MPKRDKGAGLRISGAAINKAWQSWCEEVTHPPGTQRGLCSASAAPSPSAPFFSARQRAACPRDYSRCHRLALAVQREDKYVGVLRSRDEGLKATALALEGASAPRRGQQSLSKASFRTGGNWVLSLIFVASKQPRAKKQRLRQSVTGFPSKNYVRTRAVETQGSWSKGGDEKAKELHHAHGNAGSCCVLWPPG
ncbi:unnamed protein product [Coccothraustes coccothraustes]